MRSRISLLLFCLLSCFPAPLYASRPFLATEKAAPIERGTSRLEMGYEYARISGTDTRQTVLFELTHGLLNNLDFEVEVPVIFADTNNNSDAGLGDLRLKSKVRFLKGREANPLSLSGQLAIKFPTCDKDKGAISGLIPGGLTPGCTGETDVGLLGIASKTFSPITVHLNLGYTFVGNPPARTLDDVFSYNLAFEYDTALHGLTLLAELMGEVNRNIPFSGQDPLAFLYGATYEVIPNLSVDGAFSAGFTEGSPDYTFTVGLAYYF
jgi:hypothetical protein